ncbi:MAG TPA: serine hydrolase domain-containing protein [Candidatus Eremiobacteraceae bacterium]|nr:serine hydrolase domain-containing protein [Candidatus Eremiobacteraceae bacterium]
MRFKFLAAAFIALAFACRALADTSQLPAGPMGQRVSSYVVAFNAGQAQMLAWVKANMTAQAIAARTNADQIALYQRMRGDLKSLKFLRVLSGGPAELTIEVRGGSGDPVTMDFRFDGSPLERVTGLGVRIGAGAVPPLPSVNHTLDDVKLSVALRAFLKTRTGEGKFSGSVLVAHHGSTVFGNAYGSANKPFGIPNSLTTRFNLGSIDKLMTRIAIEQLVEAGRLHYDDKLASLLPSYPNHDAARRVDLQQLVDMTSGIGDFFGAEFDSSPKDRFRSLQDYLPLFGTRPLAFAPGSAHLYSNGGYVVLGLIIERVTGTSYYDYVERHIFAPAGMTDSGWYDVDDPVTRVATGYTQTPGGLRSNIYELPARGSSAGGGYSTSLDLLKFARALEGGRLLNTLGTALVLGPGIGIAGGTAGCNAALEIDPQSGYIIVVLSNYDPPSAEAVDAQIRAWLGL